MEYTFYPDHMIKFPISGDLDKRLMKIGLIRGRRKEIVRIVRFFLSGTDNASQSIETRLYKLECIRGRYITGGAESFPALLIVDTTLVI